MNATHAELVNINDLSSEERMQLVKATYAKKSYFQELFRQDMVEYDIADLAYAFRDQISRILIEKKLIQGAVELERLHEYLSDEQRAYDFDDGVNKISTYFYDTDNDFTAVYHRFIRFLRTDFIKEPFLFQKIPTLRIHCPNARNSNHYPRYHTDINYGHPPEEINIWVPFTKPMPDHRFRLMDCASSRKLLERFNYSFPNFVDHAINDKSLTKECDQYAKEVTTVLGNMFAFDSRCIHTGEPMINHTRISMDIRILPVSQYEKMQIQYQGVGRRKILFAPGHCYHEQDSDHFLKGSK